VAVRPSSLIDEEAMAPRCTAAASPTTAAPSHDVVVAGVEPSRVSTWMSSTVVSV
jgi:hypothetical protein